jgi:hypothetical protein
LFVDAPAGRGKTYKLIEFAKKAYEQGKKILIASYTNSAVNRINADLEKEGKGSKGKMIERSINSVDKTGFPLAVTLDTVIIRQNSNADNVKKLMNFDVIYLDEFSMIQARFWHIMFEVKRNKPEIVFCIFGHSAQEPPVEEKRRIWKNCMTHYLTNGYYVNLNYVSGCARYTEATRVILDKFEQDQIFDPSWFIDNKNNNIILVGDSSTRDHYNKKKYEQIYNDKEYLYHVGMPIISYEKGKNYNNSEWFTITDIKENITIKNQHTQQETTINKSELKHFRFGYAETSARIQGKTLAGKYTIVVTPKTTFEQVYTMMSRATDLKNIDLKTTINGPIQLERTPLADNDRCKLIRPTRGIIYMLGNDLLKKGQSKEAKYYIGLTTQKLEDRIQYHKEKPVNENMIEFVANEFTYKALFDGYSYDKQLQELETYYIRKYIDEGKTLLNINKIKKPEESKFEIKEIKLETDKYQITDSVNNRKFRIRYNVDGKQKERTFRYNDSNKDVVYKEAQSAREQLIRELLL